ncbi:MULTISPECIES: hypothetical protein [unclassified Moraxella]|uniref:hypothetical protein n=1 Tax=unclassified Moraxella TaxID=2685852 RepID=UPI003AF44EC8
MSISPLFLLSVLCVSVTACSTLPMASKGSPFAPITQLTQPTQVTSPTAKIQAGRWLFIVEQGTGKSRISSLVLTDMNGQHSKILTQRTGTIFSLSPSRDGRYATFTAQSPNDFPHIFTLEIATGRTTLITPQRHNHFSGNLSPNNQQLLISSSLDDNPEIYLTDNQGNDPQRLTHDAAADFAPVWLPDASGFIFTSDRAGKLRPQLYQYTFDKVVQSSSQTNQPNQSAVTSTGKIKALTQNRYSSNAKISPNGQWISYIAKDAQGDIVYRVQSLATGQGNAWRNDGYADAMTFSADGQWLVYASVNTDKNTNSNAIIQTIDAIPVAQLVNVEKTADTLALPKPAFSLNFSDRAMQDIFGLDKGSDDKHQKWVIREPYLLF